MELILIKMSQQNKSATLRMLVRIRKIKTFARLVLVALAGIRITIDQNKTSLYLQKSVLPLVYEALNQVEKVRPADPIEFFAVYLLDRNKKEF